MEADVTLIGFFGLDKIDIPAVEFIGKALGKLALDLKAVFADAWSYRSDHIRRVGPELGDHLFKQSLTDAFAHTLPAGVCQTDCVFAPIPKEKRAAIGMAGHQNELRVVRDKTVGKIEQLTWYASARVSSVKAKDIIPMLVTNERELIKAKPVCFGQKPVIGEDILHWLVTRSTQIEGIKRGLANPAASCGEAVDNALLAKPVRNDNAHPVPFDVM